jgi:hypothetical protein
VISEPGVAFSGNSRVAAMANRLLVVIGDSKSLASDSGSDRG